MAPRPYRMASTTIMITSFGFRRRGGVDGRVAQSSDDIWPPLHIAGSQRPDDLTRPSAVFVDSDNPVDGGAWSCPRLRIPTDAGLREVLDGHLAALGDALEVDVSGVEALPHLDQAIDRRGWQPELGQRLRPLVALDGLRR